MEKNTCLTLAQAYWVCLQSIFELQKIQQKSCNIALIKSECSYPEIVPALHNKVVELPDACTNLLPAQVDEKTSPIILRERVWGLKIGNMLAFDAGNYALDSLMRYALNIPMAKVFSDKIVCYHANGRRVVKNAKPITLVNRFKRPPMADWFRIDFDDATRFFPEETAKLAQDYPDVLSKNWRLLTDPNAETLVIAQDETSDHYVPFKCMINGNPINTDFCDPIVEKLNGFGNLQPLFHEFALMLKNGQYEQVAQNSNLHCFERGYYTREPYSSTLYSGTNELELKVGYVDLPFEQALPLVQDQFELKNRFLRGERLFSVDVKGNIICSDNIINSKDFKATKRRVLLMPEFVYESWGRDFSEDVLNFLVQDRKFDYCQYSNDYIRNISGHELEQFKNLKKIARIAKVGAKVSSHLSVQVAKVGVSAAGCAAVGLGRVLFNAFDTLAYHFESTMPVEGVHFSSPERIGCITGRIHPRD